MTGEGTYNRTKGTEFLKCEHDWFVFFYVYSTTPVLVDTLQGNIGRVILNETDTGGKRKHCREIELQISPAALFLLQQNSVEDSEKLRNSLLTTAVPWCRTLEGEGVDATIMTTNPKSTVTSVCSPD